MDAQVKSRPVSTEQMLALLNRIMTSRDTSSERAKKAICWLLLQSNLLTREVVVYLEGDFGKETSYAIHDMNSVNGSSRIDLTFRAMESDWHLRSGTSGIGNHHKYHVAICRSVVGRLEAEQIDFDEARVLAWDGEVEYPDPKEALPVI